MIVFTICQIVLIVLINMSTQAVLLKNSNENKNIVKICSMGLVILTAISIVQFGAACLFVMNFDEYRAGLAINSIISTIINIIILFVPFALLLISKRLKQILIVVPIYSEIITIIYSLIMIIFGGIWGIMLIILSTTYMVIFFIKYKKIISGWRVEEQIYISDFIKKFIMGIILGIFVLSWIGLLNPPENEIVFVIVMIIGILSLSVCSVLFYLIPTIVAVKRKHLQKVPIILINILLGWSLIGWIVALVWACMKSKDKEIYIYNEVSGMDVKEKLEVLDNLHKKGLINDEEFERKKSEIIKNF